jgi:opacity protein-like surface antigen
MQSLRSRILALAVAAGMVGATPPAFAQDRWDRYAYPPLWQGLYLGVHAGYGEMGPLDGALGGGHIGYNWQRGHIVYGWEGDVSIADISWEFLDITAEVDWLASLRGRIGYLFHPDYLAYLSAGLAYAHVEVAHDFLGSVDDGGTGFVFGIGLEARLSEASTLRVEYLDHDDLDIVRFGLSFRLGRY